MSAVGKITRRCFQHHYKYFNLVNKKNAQCLNQITFARHLSFWKRFNGIFKTKIRYPINHEVVLPGNVSQERKVPEHILKPPYAESGFVEPAPLEIEIKNEEQQEKMRKSCYLAKMILSETEKQIGVGVTTDEIDQFVHDLCIEHNCYPSPLHYNGFPKSVCTSVNNIAVHGIPDDRALVNGDIISIDISIYYDGYHGDCAGTYAVGNVDIRGHHLMRAAQICLANAIAICRPDQAFQEIGRIVSITAKDLGFNVCPAFCGHGIGSYFHGPPDIVHIENHYPKKMQEGMVFTIEPVITEGGPDVFILEDGWTAATVDNCRTAQYEHTILITSLGNEILTTSLGNDILTTGP